MQSQRNAKTNSTWLSAMARFPLIAAALVTASVLGGCNDDPAVDNPSAAAPKPALTVSLTTAKTVEWAKTLAANGDIAAWQEAVIGAEISNYRLTQVLVNVGDQVKQGQVLAHISSDTVAAELAQTRAAVAESEAALAEARGNAERARRLQSEGFYSAQMGSQYLTGEQTAQARLDAARARMRADELRLAKTHVLAPDAGVISARAATVGSLAQSGQELFRLIRGGRLEWRAELAEPLDEALLSSYEQLRTRFGGVAIAQLTGGRCSGCHLSLPAVELDTIKRAPAGQQVTCPECGRLLAR